MYIERKQEETPAVSFYHKIADIPNGVTIKTQGITNGTVIPEGSPVYADNDGLYSIVGVANVVEVAASNAVNYSVAKGSILKVGQKLIKDSSTSVDITSINTTDPTKDIITVSATIGAKTIGSVLTQGELPKPVAVTGELHTVETGKNIFSSAWVIAVINKNMSPEPASKPDGVYYR